MRFVYFQTYFTIAVLVMIDFIRNESYLVGDSVEPNSPSVLVKGTISRSAVLSNLIILVCALLGLTTTVLMVIGVKWGRRFFLVPWLINMTLMVLVELINYGYLIFTETLNMTPLSAIIYTVAFFLTPLHMYSIICVLSLYQELRLEELDELDAYEDNGIDEFQAIYNDLGNVAGNNEENNHGNIEPVVRPPSILAVPSAQHNHDGNKKKVKFLDAEMAAEKAKIREAKNKEATDEPSRFNNKDQNTAKRYPTDVKKPKIKIIENLQAEAAGMIETKKPQLDAVKIDMNETVPEDDMDDLKMNEDQEIDTVDGNVIEAQGADDQAKADDDQENEDDQSNAVKIECELPNVKAMIRSFEKHSDEV